MKRFKTDDIVVVAKKCYCGHKDCMLKINIITKFLYYTDVHYDYNNENCKIEAPDGSSEVSFSDKLLRRATKQEYFLYLIHGAYILESTDE